MYEGTFFKARSPVAVSIPKTPVGVKNPEAHIRFRYSMGGFPFRGLVGTFGVGRQRARPDVAMTFDELTRDVQVGRLVTRVRAHALSRPSHLGMSLLVRYS